MKKIRAIIGQIVAVFAVAAMCISGVPEMVMAAETEGVYTVSLERYFLDPQTGLSGWGTSSDQAIGQGMVEGAVSSTGLLEVTNGKCYLTVRITMAESVGTVSFGERTPGAGSYKSLSSKCSQDRTSSNNSIDYSMAISSTASTFYGKMFVTKMGVEVTFFVKIGEGRQPGSGDFAVTHYKEQPATTTNPGSSGGSNKPAATTKPGSSDGSNKPAATTKPGSSGGSNKPAATTNPGATKPGSGGGSNNTATTTKPGSAGESDKLTGSQGVTGNLTSDGNANNSNGSIVVGAVGEMTGDELSTGSGTDRSGLENPVQTGAEVSGSAGTVITGTAVEDVSGEAANQVSEVSGASAKSDNKNTDKTDSDADHQKKAVKEHTGIIIISVIAGIVVLTCAGNYLKRKGIMEKWGHGEK